MTYAENWALISKLHKHFLAVEKDKPASDTKERYFPTKAPEQDSTHNYTLATTPIFNPLSTPAKTGSCKFLEEGKSRWQWMSLI